MEKLGGQEMPVRTKAAVGVTIALAAAGTLGYLYYRGKASRARTAEGSLAMQAVRGKKEEKLDLPTANGVHVRHRHKTDAEEASSGRSHQTDVGSDVTALRPVGLDAVNTSAQNGAEQTSKILQSKSSPKCDNALDQGAKVCNGHTSISGTRSTDLNTEEGSGLSDKFMNNSTVGLEGYTGPIQESRPLQGNGPPGSGSVEEEPFKYGWIDQMEELHIFVLCEAGSKPAMVNFRPSTYGIFLQLKEDVIVDGKLSNQIRPDDCYWSFEPLPTLEGKKSMVVTLAKATTGPWLNLLQEGCCPAPLNRPRT
eukprot:jgi/Botrbrau1/22959/Bobra.0030s0031.1